MCAALFFLEGRGERGEWGSGAVLRRRHLNLHFCHLLEDALLRHLDTDIVFVDGQFHHLPMLASSAVVPYLWWSTASSQFVMTASLTSRRSRKYPAPPKVWRRPVRGPGHALVLCSRPQIIARVEELAVLPLGPLYGPHCRNFEAVFVIVRADKRGVGPPVAVAHDRERLVAQVHVHVAQRQHYHVAVPLGLCQERLCNLRFGLGRDPPWLCPWRLCPSCSGAPTKNLYAIPASLPIGASRLPPPLPPLDVHRPEPRLDAPKVARFCAPGLADQNDQKKKVDSSRARAAKIIFNGA